MGVSGCGKTTVGRALADQLEWTFIESDDFHSQSDIRKMTQAIPLTDDDRWPWLQHLNRRIKEAQRRGENVVLACSALKQSYRQLLHQGINNGVFVYLKGSYDVIFERMATRHHFMKNNMLQSQFYDLEKPENALIVDIQQPVEDITQQIMRGFHLASP